MHFLDTDIAGVKVMDPSPHQDACDRFFRAWCQREFSERGIHFVHIQANMGRSASKRDPAALL